MFRLHTLNLAGNKLDDVDGAMMGSLVSVTSLDLSENNIASFPNQLGRVSAGGSLTGPFKMTFLYA